MSFIYLISDSDKSIKIVQNVNQMLPYGILFDELTYLEVTGRYVNIEIDDRTMFT